MDEEETVGADASVIEYVVEVMTAVDVADETVAEMEGCVKLL